MSATWVTFLFEAANFLLLATVLGWLFFRPVRDALERRRSEFENAQCAAAEARARAGRALEEAQTHRAEQQGSLEKMRERVLREAEAERERLIEDARAQTQRERETLKEELVSLRRAQTRALTRDAAFAAKQILVRLLGEMNGPELESSLLRTACRAVEQLRSSGPLAPVVIESVRPLDDIALDDIAKAAGVAAMDATQRVNLELVAGIRVLTARGLVDISAAGLAAQVARVLVGRIDQENSNHG